MGLGKSAGKVVEYQPFERLVFEQKWYSESHILKHGSNTIFFSKPSTVPGVKITGAYGASPHYSSILGRCHQRLFPSKAGIIPGWCGSGASAPASPPYDLVTAARGIRKRDIERLRTSFPSAKRTWIPWYRRPLSGPVGQPLYRRSAEPGRRVAL